MALTKAEKKRLTSYRNKANKLAKEGMKLARKVDKELEKQMRKS